MVSLDTNSSVTQSLVDQLVSSATVNGAFSLAAFESELSSVVNQVLSLAESGAAQITGSTSSTGANGSTGSQSTSGSNSSGGDTTTSTAPAETSGSSGASQNLVATQSQQPASTSEPILAMFGGGLPPLTEPMVVQSGNLLVSSTGEVSLATAGTPSAPNTAAPHTQTSAAGSYTAGTMIHSYDPLWGNLAGPLVPASGTTWTQLSSGQALDSGAVIAGLETRYGAGTARMLTVLYDQFGAQAYNDYSAQSQSANSAALDFASLPPMTAFQFYGPDNSFADPNNQNQYCYFDENGVEHLSGAGSYSQA